MSSKDRGPVIQVPIHTRDWELFLGSLVTLANGVEQAGEKELREKIKAALDRQQRVAAKQRSN